MKLPSFYILHDKKHAWAVCGGCGLMVVCGTCGNNCCNGGYGTLEDNSECPDCSSAYDYQDTYRDEAETYYADALKEIEIKKEQEDE